MPRTALPTDYGVQRIVDPWPEELEALAARYAPGFTLTDAGERRWWQPETPPPTWIDADNAPPGFAELAHDHRSDVQDLGQLVQVHVRFGPLAVRVSTPLHGAPLAAAVRALGVPSPEDRGVETVEVVCLPRPSREMGPWIARSVALKRVVVHGVALPSLVREALAPWVEAAVEANGGRWMPGFVAEDGDGVRWDPVALPAGQPVGSRWFSADEHGITALERAVISPPHDALTRAFPPGWDTWSFPGPRGVEAVVPVEPTFTGPTPWRAPR